jgi:hypothetical protein
MGVMDTVAAKQMKSIAAMQDDVNKGIPDKLGQVIST